MSTTIVAAPVFFYFLLRIILKKQNPASTPILSHVVQEAEDAFWTVVADHFPDATNGDLSPETTLQFRAAAEIAVREWIENNT